MFWNKNGATTESVVNDYLTWRLKNKSSSSTTNRLFTIVHNIGSDCERIYTPQQPIFNFQYVPSFSLNNCIVTLGALCMRQAGALFLLRF
ncbi:unnamed protein product [Rotaria socialis]|uniref:Uncharacterized protein n=1 Tax=Rotaria socialis TaxID=392032 RepID=A0A818KJ35_9BILA|nr:unnamed protein product [Rotaria socialis]